MAGGIVTTDGRPIFASFDEVGGVVTIAVRTAEWIGLEVGVGETVAVELPNRRERPL